MADTKSYIETLRQFGSELGLPKVNVDQLLETQKKNIDALGDSAKVAAQGAQSVAQKQREVLEAGLREAIRFAREYRPLGKVEDNVALQTEYAKKAFEIAIKGAQETATTARQSSADVAKIIQDRMKESLEEIRAGARTRQVRLKREIQGAASAKAQARLAGAAEHQAGLTIHPRRNRWRITRRN